ncbi:MAG: hypothetical protein ACTSXQ_04470 [Alphaproteobacteria bacterium]
MLHFLLMITMICMMIAGINMVLSHIIPSLHSAMITSYSIHLAIICGGAYIFGVKMFA